MKEIAVEVPALVGVIVVVWFFLRALRERDATIREIARDFASAMREHTEEGKNLRETIGAHSEVMKRCQQVIAQKK